MNSKIPYINIHTHAQSLVTVNEVLAVRSFSVIDFTPEQVAASTAFTVGLHPWNVQKSNFEQALVCIKSAAVLSGFFGIGEIGLDRTTETPLETQQKAFEQQLLLAQTLQVPVVVHAVRTVPEILHLYKKNNCTVPLIFHGFRGKLATARQILRVEYAYLSFGAALLADENQIELLPYLPLNRLLFETDDAKVSIEQIYHKAAIVLAMDIDRLKVATYTNFIELQG